MNLARAFLDAATERPDEVAVRTYPASSAGALTWRQLYDQVAAFAAGLHALGVERGSVVATMLTNRAEFFVADLAATCLGAIPVAIYNTSPAPHVATILRDSGARILVTERAFADVAKDACGRIAQPPRLFVVDDNQDSGILGDGATGVDLAARVAEIRPDDIATLVYTSGTTGNAKGVELTHDNLVGAWEAIVALNGRPVVAPRVVSYLPQAHIGDRVYGYHVAIFGAGSITCVPDYANAVDAIADAKPTVFVGVPRIWEKLRARALDNAGAGTNGAGHLGLTPQALLLSGSAPIEQSVLKFFESLGLAVLEGYGMTEATCIISGNGRQWHRPGTVGQPARGVKVKIAPDGEILVRGRTIMRGYRGQSNDTADAFTEDGWFKTGDLGWLDEDGYLTITGRIKDIIITTTGKNIAPTRWEGMLRAHSDFVSQAAVIGDRRPYLTALIVLDRAAVCRRARREGWPLDPAADFASDEHVRGILAAVVDDVNNEFPRAARIRRFAVVNDVWDPASGLVTPSLKPRRPAIAERYESIIDALYAGRSGASSEA